MKKYIKKNDDSGFTLIELVVAVSVLMTLSVMGVVAYGGIIDNNRENAMELTASSVVNRIMSNIMDYDDNTTVEAAVENFVNETQPPEMTVSTMIDENNCVNVVVKDNNNRIENVYLSNDKFCNLSKEEIG